MINPRYYSFDEIRMLTLTRTLTGWTLALTHWCSNPDAEVTTSTDVSESDISAISPIDTAEYIYHCSLCGDRGQVREGQWIPL